MIPVSRPVISEDMIAAALDCLQSGWISSAGKYLDAFETGWARFCGRKHGIAVSNGTAALEVALQALPRTPGRNEIIIPSFTIISCALAAVRAGYRPVFVDVDPETWCIDLDQLEARLRTHGANTAAVMPVHMYGHPVDMRIVQALCEKHGIACVEDAAEAHGAESLDAHGAWVKCGAWGAASCFSFYANKLITTGEGGMVLTNNDEIAARARRTRNLGFKPEQRFVHDELAHNFRLTNLQAALGVRQVERIDQIVLAKRRQGERYQQLLKSFGGIQLQAIRAWARPVYWMFGLLLDDSVPYDAKELALRLHGRGIETRPFFVGMHEQRALKDLGLLHDVQPGSFPVSTRLAKRGLYLPSSVDLTDAEQDAVCAALADALVSP